MSALLVARPHLTPPERGEGVLVHDATFERWDASFGVMRDVVNLGVDALNQAGAGLPSLPPGSLRELLVDPLCGDYGAIRRNADACRETGLALGRWSLAVEDLAVEVARDWQGLAGTACAWRLTRLAVVGGSLAAVVARGARVFERVATEAERLGVRVERLVVDLGQALARLARKLLARVGGPAGWAVFAADLVLHGLSTVTDLVDDVRRVVALFEDLLALRDTVRAWARATREDLDLLLDLPGLLRPGTGNSVAGTPAALGWGR